MKNRILSKKDPFNKDLSIGGFYLQLLVMQGEIYDFYYNFAFKRHKKGYSWRYHLDHGRLYHDYNAFIQTGDKIVIHCVKVRKLLIEFQDKCLNPSLVDPLNGELSLPDLMCESRRFEPRRILLKKQYSYKYLKQLYEIVLERQIIYLYTMACVYTTSKYEVPGLFIEKFDLQDHKSLYLLDTDSEIIAGIKELIIVLMAALKELARWHVSRMPKGKWIEFAEGEIDQKKDLDALNSLEGFSKN
jgi:hypothetical protein